MYMHILSNLRFFGPSRSSWTQVKKFLILIFVETVFPHFYDDLLFVIIIFGELKMACLTSPTCTHTCTSIRISTLKQVEVTMTYFGKRLLGDLEALARDCCNSLLYTFVRIHCMLRRIYSIHFMSVTESDSFS